MILKKIFFFSLLFFISNTVLLAQQTGDYLPNWQKIDSLEDKGLTSSARQEVLSLFKKAVKEKNDPQQIKAAMYLVKYRSLMEEESSVNNYFYLDTLILQTKAPTKNILQSLQAEMLLNYKNQNRWKFYNRTELAVEQSKDIATWSLEKLLKETTAKYELSLQDEDVLQNTSLQQFSAIINKGQNAEGLRPTLYDLLAHRALDFYMSSENDVIQPAYKFIIDNPEYFGPVTEFVQLNITTQDSASLYYHALVLFQDLFRFHLKDKDRSALADANLKRLEFVHEHAVLPNKDGLYELALAEVEQRFQGTEQAAEAAYLGAYRLFQSGEENDDDSLHMNDKVKAKRIAESIIKKYPTTDAAVKAQNLVDDITHPSLQLQAEQVNTINMPFRMLVDYKNVSRIYLKVFKTTRSFVKANDEDWEKLLAQKSLKSWEQLIPATNDYRNHSVEIKVDGLPSGIYYVVASLHADFNEDSNLMAFQLVHVSDISYILHDNKEMFVLDRNTGKPLSNAAVQVWKDSYDYGARKYTSVKKASYTTDANGFVGLGTENKNDNYSFEIKHENDGLFLTDNYYLYNYNYDSDVKDRKQTFLFTDRSIYRPGQKVFFKGIIISSDKTGKKNAVVADQKTTVILYDANGQKKGSLKLISNSYGSYNGSFTLPEGQMNGQFYISDSLTKSSQYFSVEEYKRPKFSVDINQPEGSYRVNDSISVKGTAKAFAGNNVDGAKVSYRVVRTIQYPWWWGWRMPYKSTDEMEIINGIATTDASGDFTIKFKAIPDETVDKKGQPTFTYEVSADVTDINGETHSGSTNVAVKYQALTLSIVTPEELDADSLQKIKISSTNTNGVFEKAKVQLQVEKLQANEKIFRSRYWAKPDQFLMTREEYYSYFPYDEYRDESNEQTWAVERTLQSTTDSTSADGSWAIKDLPEGWYRLTATTTDKYGEAVKDVKYIHLTGKRTTLTKPFVSEQNKNSLQPGEELTYTYKTGFKDIWVIEETKKTDQESRYDFIAISSKDPYDNKIPVREADRGGIYRSQAFVLHNRLYSFNQLTNVPWTDKELNIDYSSFRDNILPGSEENWSIKISGDKKDAVAAEALISMYDASLDELKPHSWQNLQSIWANLKVNARWTYPGFKAVRAEEEDDLEEGSRTVKPVIYPSLIELPDYYNRRYNSKPMFAAPVSDANLEEVVVTALGVKRESSGYLMEVEADSVAFNMKTQKEETAPSSAPIQIRKNFNETAFFFPDLKTDTQGNISFSFTIPEALTKWKMMTLAHTQELASAYSERTLITQKPLMVQPNAPRFLREGDAMEFSAKVVNLTDQEITGTAALQLFDATTETPVDGLFNNIFPNQYFTVVAGQSVAVKFPIAIPINFNSALSYRITAQSSTKDSSGNTFSDGEQAALPVLTNRMLVTETLPLNVRNTNSKDFTFTKLINSEKNSATLTHQSLTVEYTSNPAWYAVQALPYLMEYPYECAEQSWNRYYANTLAAYVANSTPKLKKVFEQWAAGGKDSAALMSNLQKNEELKSALLEETPWVLQAKSETEQKKNIGILFNMVRLAKEKQSTFNKLKDMQMSNGGFSWFKGGRDDRYITQYILTGIGHLRKLKALTAEDETKLKSLINAALAYLDQRMNDEYNDLIRYKVKLTENHLSNLAIQYLYMRSFFPEKDVSGTVKKAYDYFYGQAQQYWLQNNKYSQAMIALAMHRTNNEKTAKAVIASLKENAIYNEEMGMYWKDLSTGGYYWYQAPIESQSMIIEAFADIDKNEATLNELKTWLLKQKQTQNWRTTKATAEACYALLMNGSNWLAEEKIVSISLGKNTVVSSAKSAEAGTGYFKETIPGNKVEPEMGRVHVEITKAPPAPQGGSTTQKSTSGITNQMNISTLGSGDAGTPSWGAVYWQYFEDLDKITSAETPLKLQKNLFIEKNGDRGPVLTAVKDGDELSVGDKLKVRIELRVDCDMEYVHMKDMRAAATEPVNVISSYKYQDELGYYESTKDASTNFFFSSLPKGTYVFEYPVFVTHTGNFSNGITTIQCMYAPEFTSHSEGVRIEVK